MHTEHVPEPYKKKTKSRRKRLKRTKPWELSDALWERIRPLIPVRPAHPKGGRPAQSDRQMLAAILYVLRTGIQWNALPRELGASTTVYDRFRLWEEQGVFEQVWQAGLQEYDELEGIAWEWQSMDGVMTKAPDRVEPRPAPILPIAARREPNAAN